MKTARVKETYVVIGVDNSGDVIPNDEIDDCSTTIDQYQGETLIVWKTRKKDGAHFVYSNRLGIGYWVHPNLIKMD